MCFACKLLNQLSSKTETTKSKHKELGIDAEDPFPLEGELVFQAQSQDKSLMKLCENNLKIMFTRLSWIINLLLIKIK